MSKSVSQENFLQSLSDALVEVTENVSPSVVQVSAGRGLGSGVVWNKHGHVVTSNHVVGRSKEVEVTIPNGRSYDASLIGQDRYSDIAVLKIDNSEDLVPIERGDSERLAVGQFVLALANPFGEIVAATFGIVTNPRASVGGPWSGQVVITDTKLNPGYSGGPLVDASGRMVGMNAGAFSNRGIAIPVSTLEAVVRDLSNDGKIRRAYLGVISQPIELPDDAAREVGQEEGLLVLSVEAGTPAKRAGIAVGDIIVKIDSKQIKNYYDLQRLLTSGLIGKSTRVSVLRGEKPVELAITPSEV